MSYTFAICNAPLPTDYKAAKREVEQLVEQPEPDRAAFDRLVDQLTARYPCIYDLPDVDSGLWCSGPLRQKQFTRATVFGLVHSRVDEVLPFVLETATALGFTVLDWQTGKVHRPAS
jgi:hypothetical protein